MTTFVITRYVIHLQDTFALNLRKGGKCLSVGNEPSDVDPSAMTNVLYVLEQPDRPYKLRHFRLAYAALEFSDDGDLDFVGTFKINGNGPVAHLFET